MSLNRRLSRRDLLRVGVGAVGVGLIAACAPQPPAPSPTAVPKAAEPPKPSATTAPAAAAKPTEQPQPAAKPAESKPATPAAKVDEKPGRHLIGKLEGPELIADPAQSPKSFKEAPQLAELVKQSKLPPVQERIGQDPLVIKPVHETGRYGGTWRRGFTGPADAQNGARVAGNDRLVHWDYTGTKLVPHVARGWEFSPDGKTMTILLRRGMKWSDGQPFTADDFVFWFEDLYKNKDLNPTPTTYMITKSGEGVVEKVDQYTVAFKFKDPYYVFPFTLAGVTPVGGHVQQGQYAMGGFAPAHYLKQFHPKYASKEELDKKVADGKFDNWVTLLKNKNSWHLNPELPAVTPWTTVQPINKTSWVLERNPYSVWVDTEGNQLPYIDKISMSLGENLEVINLRAIAGEYDSQERHTDPAKLPAFLENQQRGNYKVYLDSGAVGSDMLLMFNQSYDGDAEVAKWMTTTEFRQALALGIDRDQLNETFWLGLGVPSSSAPWEESRYSPGPEYRTLWATLDVKKANEMLDKIGLDKKDAEGYRLRTDGQGRLRLQIDTFLGFLPFTQICEMIREQWKKIGIAAEVREFERSLFIRRRTGNEAQIGVDVAWGTENLYSHAQAWLFPFDPTSGLGPVYGTWFNSNGTQGKEPPARIKEVMSLYRDAFSAQEQQHYEMGKQIWKIALEEVWAIATVGLSPAVQGVRIAKNNMGNQPSRMFNGSSTLSPQQDHPETYYFKS